MAARNTPLTCAGHTRPVVHLAFSPKQEDDGTYLLVSSCKDGNPMLRDWRGDWVGTFVGQTQGRRVANQAVLGQCAGIDGFGRLYGQAVGYIYGPIAGVSPARTHCANRRARTRGTKGMTAGQEKKVRIGTWVVPDKAPMHRSVVPQGSRTGDGARRNDQERGVGRRKPGCERGRRCGGEVVGSAHAGVALSSQVARSPDFMELSIPTHTLTITHGKTVSFVPLAGPESGPSHQVTLVHAPSSASLHPVFGDRFVAGSVGDPWVRVYGLEMGEEREVYKGHHGPVHCVEYSPDGEMYATGSEDGTIRLWQTTPGKSYGLWQGTINGAS
ncbi:WD domain, G-beta repeat [Rhizoctonia solani]|uniref:Serine-threonine kinase receptor-associated protein n=1 Tax=Rhizoctonia solani TaxID=456999 RepID=A0A8H7IB93_9AGAM|nr:WD domain, G-beta repeat [Rhizoctonia solani]